MTTDTFKHVWFIGGGGIGMAALERYFMSRGVDVGAYDRTPTDLTAELQAEGVEMTFDESVDAIPARFRNPADTMVVYTPAVPPQMPQMQWFEANRFTPVKRAEVLGHVTRGSKAICVAGTHGKTTTSSMIAHLLQVSGIGSNAFLGGVMRNYNSNLLLSADSPYSVVEADEYDRSFHRLLPYVAVITATDPDHLDIYGTEEAYLEGFAHFTELINPQGGKLVIHTGLKLKPCTAPGVKTYTYSATDGGDFHAENIYIGNGSITFDFVGPDSLRISGIELGVPVEVNIDNAVAALAALAVEGLLQPEAARSAMRSFMGARRRFEFWLKTPDRVIIDDYAHHPDELRASITSVRKLYPGRNLTVAFQPHLYSRTRDFASGFAEALSLADRVMLIDIYPAREEPIPGVTSKIIFDSVKAPQKCMLSKKDLPEALKNTNFEILLTAGAGDISDCLPAIKQNAVETAR